MYLKLIRLLYNNNYPKCIISNKLKSNQNNSFLISINNLKKQLNNLDKNLNRIKKLLSYLIISQNYRQ
jgi:hypothetical protein